MVSGELMATVNSELAVGWREHSRVTTATARHSMMTLPRQERNGGYCSVSTDCSRHVTRYCSFDKLFAAP